MTGSDRTYSRLTSLKAVGRRGLQAFSLIAFAAATNVAAQAPKLRTVRTLAASRSVELTLGEN